MQASSSSSTERWRPEARPTAIGLAHSDFAERVVAQNPGLVDYVEVPFELLLRNEAVARLADQLPLVLHSATLSIAGNVVPPEPAIEQLGVWANKVSTPWIGEHLAFIRATSPDQEASAPFEVGYTVSPQYSAATLERVVAAHTRWEERLRLPILLENSPLAFAMPGSEMSQFDFLRALAARLARPRLLLDLAHFLLTCRNFGLDAEAELEALPVEAVVELHVSGIRCHDGLWWDDHSQPAEPALFGLLERVLARTRPRAITIEYNWDERFPLDRLRRHVAAVRELTARV